MVWSWMITLTPVLLVTLVQGSKFTINIDQGGMYTIDVNQKTWLYSGSTSFRANGVHHSTTDGSLKLDGPPTVGNGSDVLGRWQADTYLWRLGKHNAVETIVTNYPNVNVAIFSQYYSSDVKGTKLGNKNGVISSFPSFRAGKSDVDLGFMTFGGLFIGWVNIKSNIARWTPTLNLTDGLDSGPVVLFDENGNVLIISPFSHFMAASFAHDRKENVLSWGIMGDVGAVPAGFRYSTIVYFSDKGINHAMKEWGTLLRKWYHRSEASRRIDLSNNYIGYYTDNGAYYYHHTEPGTNYEQTVAKIVNYTNSQHIPYRYVQLDDWWYPIQGPGYGATITWTADPKIFPHGLQYIYNMTHWPVVAHNRYWSNITPYATQNGGKFHFLMDGKLALPDDQTFWDYLMWEAKTWGLVVYEQDWLNYQVENLTPLHTDLTLGRRWLQQMGEAASRYGVQLQYCMAQPRHLLASLEVPAVSQIRVSIDYQLNKSQWQIGITSMFADALGVAPFKDNFWTKFKQPGNPYNATEPNPLLQATVALLSTGPVGISDKVGHTDVKVTARLTNAEGLLLKPSKPATVIDPQIIQRAFGSGGPDGEVWTTHSIFGDVFYGLIFCPQINGSYKLTPEAAGFLNTSYVVHSYKDDLSVHPPRPFSRHAPLTLTGCRSTDFCLYYASPVLTFKNESWVLLGELDKLVPMSPQRVTALEYGADDITITLTGKPGEGINFHALHNGIHVGFMCTISSAGTATISMNIDYGCFYTRL